MRKLLIAVFLTFGAIIAGSLAYAPYLPQFIFEGIPPLTWNNKGNYASIAISQPTEALDQAPQKLVTALPPRLQEIFDESNGKALLLMHDDVLRLEHYADDISIETKFNSYSIAKSLVAALIFRAIADGKLDGLDVTLGEVLPKATGIAHVSLRNLLTMRAGIQLEPQGDSIGPASGEKFNDPFPNPFGALARLHFVGIDAIEPDLTTQKDLEGQFSYQNVNTALLGHVLETVYQQPLQQQLSEKIWKPSGAGSAIWRMPQETGSVSAYCCIFATARDWVKVGNFIMHNGTAGSRFLPQSLWQTYLGLGVGIQARRQDHYGMHTHQNILDRDGENLQGPFTYFIGQYGQILYIMPTQNLVVYRAGENQQLLHSTLYEAWNATALN